MEFYERVCSLRMKEGLRQKELADRLKVSKASISAYENRKAMPSIDIALLMADFFEVSLDYLFCRTDYPKPIISGDAKSLALIKENDRIELARDILTVLSNYEITRKL